MMSAVDGSSSLELEGDEYQIKLDSIIVYQTTKQLTLFYLSLYRPVSLYYNLSEVGSFLGGLQS